MFCAVVFCFCLSSYLLLFPLSLRVSLLLAAVVVCSLCFVVRFRLFDLYRDAVVICLFVVAVVVFHCSAIFAVSQ